MRILLVNNKTEHLLSFSSILKDHEVEIRDYRPGMDFSCPDKDLVILSGGGGEGLEIDDEHAPGKLWYEDQMEFIRRSQKPIIGICMGFEVICRSFGAKVEKLPKGIQGFVEFETNRTGRYILNKSKLNQFEAHDWAVSDTPQGFQVLAQSSSGIEIIRHQTRPIIATQFHPEKGGTLKLFPLLQTTLL